MHNVRTLAVVAASLLTGSLLTVAGVSIADAPAGHKVVKQATIGDPYAWVACVETTYNMGGGSDADLLRCDRLYPVADTIRAECEWNAGEGGQDWPADLNARCGWSEGPALPRLS